MAKSKTTAGEGWSFTQACTKCGKHGCSCREQRSEPSGKPTVRLRMEKRRGKPVTVAAATDIPAADLSVLLKEAKALCGAGGTLKDGEIEIQGEHRDRLRPVFAARGYVVKG